MAKDFLPKVITWFRLDEHVRRLKEFIDSLTTRVETLENASTPSGETEVPYKVYTALLTQSGTDAPVATVLENTLGDIVWTRTGVGQYSGTLIGGFTTDKTFIPPYSSDFSGSSIFLPLSINGNPQLGWINMYISGTDAIIVDTYDMVDRAEWSTIIEISKIPIEIKVYN